MTLVENVTDIGHILYFGTLQRSKQWKCLPNFTRKIASSLDGMGRLSNGWMSFYLWRIRCPCFHVLTGADTVDSSVRSRRRINDETTFLYDRTVQNVIIRFNQSSVVERVLAWSPTSTWAKHCAADGSAFTVSIKFSTNIITVSENRRKKWPASLFLGPRFPKWINTGLTWCYRFVQFLVISGSHYLCKIVDLKTYDWK